MLPTQHPEGAKSLSKSPTPLSLVLSQAPSSPWECGVAQSHSQLIPFSHPKPLSQTYSQQSKCFFLVREVWICVEELFTHPAHPQSILCRELPWEPRAAFAILLLIKRKKRKPLSITSLLNNLLPQVTTDRILNDSCAGNDVPKDPGGEISGFS